MVSTGILRIISLNCNGFKSSCEFVSSLFNECDIPIFQETWLLPNEIGLPSNLRIDCHAYSTSAVDLSNGFLIGRPYGGLTFKGKANLINCLLGVMTILVYLGCH